MSPNPLRTSSREQPTALMVVLILLLVAGITMLGSHFLNLSQAVEQPPAPVSTLSYVRSAAGVTID